MENNLTDNSGIIQAAEQISVIYDEFTASVRALGPKNKRNGRRVSSGKMGQEVAGWIGGSHLHTDRDVLCDKFLEDVQKQLEFLQTCFEGASPEDIKKASSIVAEVMTQPVPPQSDSTSNLMKRAMIGQVIPFLPNLDKVQLTDIQTRILGAYTRRQLFPVEKDVLRELDHLIDEKS